MKTIKLPTDINTENSNQVDLLIEEYIADQNCWPALWIQGELSNPTNIQAFIKGCLSHPKYNK